MLISKRNFLIGFSSCIAAPFIIKNSEILMPVHDRGIINPYSSGLYVVKDIGLCFSKSVIRNEFRKLDICTDGELMKNKHYSFWLLNGAKATRLVSIG